MKKRMLGLLFIGFCVGVTIGTTVNLIISAALGGGAYFPVMPQMAAYFSKEWTAVLVFTIWVGLIGADFAMSSQFFELETWTAPRQYLTHFAVTGAVYLPFLWVCYLPQRLSSVLIMLGNLLLSYGITWGMQYAASKKHIDRINAELERRHHLGGN
ncbi:MAG: DUF3021 domain-containing protein [Oscillospiraceae bacterium]|nr:DUF3021 domain-containing protein [Oscillospiraceae bacterium]